MPPGVARRNLLDGIGIRANAWGHHRTERQQREASRQGKHLDRSVWLPYPEMRSRSAAVRLVRPGSFSTSAGFLPKVCGQRWSLSRACNFPSKRVLKASSMTETKRRILWHGMALFLIGLLTGLAERGFVNPRMGLAAHLEGVMNGTFLLALGAMWHELRLPERLETLAFRGVLYGSYANWAVTALAAAWGTAGMTPIASVGHSAQRWQEVFVTSGFVSVGIAMMASSALILYGLRSRPLARSGTNLSGNHGDIT
jgi:hydroxylaminobenzene mutase